MWWKDASKCTLKPARVSDSLLMAMYYRIRFTRTKHCLQTWAYHDSETLHEFIWGHKWDQIGYSLQLKPAHKLHLTSIILICDLHDFNHFVYVVNSKVCPLGDCINEGRQIDSVNYFSTSAAVHQPQCHKCFDVTGWSDLYMFSKHLQ